MSVSHIDSIEHEESFVRRPTKSEIRQGRMKPTTFRQHYATEEIVGEPRNKQAPRSVRHPKNGTNFATRS